MAKEFYQIGSLSDEDALWQLLHGDHSQDQNVLLDRVCGQDAEQRKRLANLLRHHQAADQLFGSLDDDVPNGNSSIDKSRFDTPQTEPSLQETPRELAALGNLQQLGNYRLTRLVGRGGMGNVFHAQDEKLHREVAIKIPRLDLMFLPGLEDRFLREAQAAARLDHPNLVSILQVGTEGPVPYIATHWCDRGDLSTWMRKPSTSRSPSEVAAFMAKVADAIQHCHDCGVVHLDLKPSNIMLTSTSDEPSGQSSLNGASLNGVIPKVTDFGLARLLEHQLDKTSTSMFLGTPLYMAPEQAECKRELIGPASDLFALGVLLHELSCGVRPFDGETVTTILDQVRRVELMNMSAMRGLPRDLRTIISRCLQRDPADRYASAGSLADDLRRFASSKPIQAQPVSIRRRLWMWCSRPERITQAGIVTIAIQFTVLANLYSHFILKGFGYETPMPFDSWTFFKESLPVVLFPHIPLLFNGFRILAFRRGSVLIGTLLSLVFLLALLSVLLGAKPSFSAYIGNPLATYIAHLFIFCLALVQFAVNIVALPAARAKLSGR